MVKQPQRDHPRLAALRATFEGSGAAEWRRTIHARYRPPSSQVAQGAA